jgi:hypothetical protein
MRVSMLVVIFLALLWSFSNAQEVTIPIVTAPYQQIGDILNEDVPKFTVEVEGRTYKVQTPHIFVRSAGAVRQVDTVFSPTPVECGKYYLRYDPGWGYSCERIGYFPWFAAGEDEHGKWRTEVVGSLSSQVVGAVNFQISMRGMDGKSKSVWGGIPSIQTVMSLIAYGHIPGRNNTFVALGNAECGITSTGISCYQKDGVVTGSVMVILKGTSEEVLDAFTTQLTFLYTTKNGTIPWQVAVPVNWWADATNRWSVPVVETPVEVKGQTLPPNNSSFAVLNLCDKPQTVRVSAHGWSGEELWAHNLPKELEAGNILPQVPDLLWSGGVYANLVSSLFGDDIKTGVISDTRVNEELPFRGMLTFKGSEDGCKIAVLGLRATGDSITSTIAHPEK